MAELKSDLTDKVLEHTIGQLEADLRTAHETIATLSRANERLAATIAGRAPVTVAPPAPDPIVEKLTPNIREAIWRYGFKSPVMLAENRSVAMQMLREGADEGRVIAALKRGGSPSKDEPRDDL